MKTEYQKALDYLYGFTDYEKRSGFVYDPERFDLRRVEQLLSLLGNPQRAFEAVHIAGTKGKGSTSAMIASVLKRAGHRTALYTSPHLHTFRERIQIDGEIISEARVIAGVGLLKEAALQVPDITAFELITGLAFQYFAQQNAEIAVVEVGMGGRLDATNVLNPLVSVITSISYDHTMYLGDTLAAIAAEKAGIIKRGVPVVSAPQPEEAQAVIVRTATEKDAALTLVGRDWRWESIRVSDAGQEFAAWPTSDPAKRAAYALPLLGRHQQVNATTSLAAVNQLQAVGVKIPQAAVHEGLESVRWPGRAEVLGRQPWVLVDGAHNADSMQKLAETISELFSYREMTLVYAASADKDIEGMLDAILRLADHVLITQTHHPRAASPHVLAQHLARRGRETSIVPIDRALEQALAQAGPHDLICATGSLFLAAEFRLAWFERAQEPLPARDPD